MNHPYHKVLLQVALPVPLYAVFDYYCPVTMSLACVGARVRVPFGGRKLVGVVTAHLESSAIAANKLKPIIEVLDEVAILSKFTLDFAYWLSTYYHYPVGETLAVMLPAALRMGEALPITQRWQATQQAMDERVVAESIKKTAKKQRADFDFICQHPSLSDGELKLQGISGRSLKTLYDKGLIEPVLDDHPQNLPTQKTVGLTLNDEQQNAVEVICHAISEGDYRGILLDGVTGSGKTEVYLQAMSKVLLSGLQVLILVPEIGLTPQSKVRFAERFDANIVVLHSGLNDAERLAGWQACQNGTAQIVIATRSAIFYPFANLGLIIVDEAHESSYKQQDHLRYHAVDVALYLGFLQKIPVILGTATPSLEQLKLVEDKKLTHCQLTKRAGKAISPTLQLVDMRHNVANTINSNGEYKQTHLSEQTIIAMKQALEKGEQVLLFLNRRGYAPVLLCQACGWQADCVRCDAHLTLHQTRNQDKGWLSCHHCGYQSNLPQACPSCHSQNLDTVGVGTAQLYERLHAVFANPQKQMETYPILQIDRDTVRSKGAWDGVYKAINTGNPMILVGTQMLAKGHHFENVSLVVVVDVDAGFWSADFRAAEQTAQTIIQVAGRAGRGDKVGRVLIQTMKPDDSVLQILVEKGYHAYAAKLMNQRSRLALPPFSHAALIRVESDSLQKSREAILAMRGKLPNPYPFAVLAPINAPLAKKNNRYFVQMLILSRIRKELHECLTWWWQEAILLPQIKGVKAVIDIDPSGW